MDTEQTTRGVVQLSARSIGGIDEATVDLGPGVTVLAGRNATNRTSFLRSLMAALGSDDVSIKADADEGDVELTIGDETYTRHLRRRNGDVVTDGDPYLADPELADLFAFLLETNEARRAVERGDDLRELIMRPVDTEEIQAEVDRLKAERDAIDDELEELTRLRGRRPELESERQRLEAEIESKQEALEEKQAELERADTDPSESREEQEELDAKLADLRAARSELESGRLDAETERQSIDALKEERSELSERLSALPETRDEELAEIEAEIDELRERTQAIDAAVSELQTVIQFNEEMLDGTSSEVRAALQGGSDSGAITDQLVAGDKVVCWTCGSEVKREQIEETLDELRSHRGAKFEERNAKRDRIEELRDERSEIEARRREYENAERRLADVDDEIERRESTLDSLEDEREELSDRISDLETAVAELEDEESDTILELHKEVNELEFEIDRLRDERDSIRSEIDEIEERLDERESVEARREDIGDELEEQRTRIDRIENDAVEQFNDHMDAVLEVLEYANLDRIWIERTEREVREGRRKVAKRTFDLHVVRRAGSGAAYEDSIDHLSESEREVTGLVFALAGYLVHEVHETVPFMLLDSLEAIDSERIAALIDYLHGYSDHLVVALLPEDAAALDEDYRRVSEI